MALKILFFPIYLCYIGLRKLGAILVHPASYFSKTKTPYDAIAQWKTALYWKKLYGEKAEYCSFKTPDGLTLDGMLFNPLSGNLPNKVALIQGGNCTCYEDRMEEGFDLLKNNGGEETAIFFFNLRGVNLSEGGSDPQKLPLDAYSAYKFLIERHNFKPSQVAFYGHSLGGAVCAAGAAMIQEEYPDSEIGGISDRSFSSVSSTIQHMLGNGYFGKFIGWLVKKLDLEIDAAAAWEKLKGKKLVLCHPRDKIIREEASLYKAAKTGTKKLLGNPTSKDKTLKNFYHNYDLSQDYTFSPQISEILGSRAPEMPFSRAIALLPSSLSAKARSLLGIDQAPWRGVKAVAVSAA